MLPLDAFFSPPDDDRGELPGSPALRAALEAVSDVVLVVDRDFQLVFLNDHAATLLRRPRAALLGTIAWETYPALRGTAFEREYRRAMETGEPVAFEARYPGGTT